jgi:hypothetical protein
MGRLAAALPGREGRDPVQVELSLLIVVLLCFIERLTWIFPFW